MKKIFYRAAISSKIFKLSELSASIKLPERISGSPRYTPPSDGIARGYQIVKAAEDTLAKPVK